MMKIFKILSAVVLLALVVIAVVVFVVAGRLNGIVKNVIEEAGSSALQTSVTLSAVDISLSEGRARLSGLRIANPEGFTSPDVFVMDDIVVDIELKPLLDSVIEIKEITIDGAQVTAEQKGMATNLQALLKNLEQGGSSGAPAPSEPGATSPADDILIKVGSFQFINSAGTVVTEQWGQASLSMPDVRLKNIGGEKGLSPEELAAAMLKPILKQFGKGLEDKVKDLMGDEAKAKLKEAEAEAKAKLNEKLQEKLGDDADSAKDALKSLFGK